VVTREYDFAPAGALPHVPIAARSGHRLTATRHRLPGFGISAVTSISDAKWMGSSYVSVDGLSRGGDMLVADSASRGARE